MYLAIFWCLQYVCRNFFLAKYGPVNLGSIFNYSDNFIPGAGLRAESKVAPSIGTSACQLPWNRTRITPWVHTYGGWERTLQKLFFPESSLASYFLSPALYLLSLAPYLLSLAPYLLSLAPYLLSLAPYFLSTAPHFRNRGYQSRWTTGVAGD
jgi:hypothetical protein